MYSKPKFIYILIQIWDFGDMGLGKVICKLIIALSLYLLLLCILYLYKIQSNLICPRTDICHANTKKSQLGSLTISPALVSFTDVMSRNLAGGQTRAHAHCYVLSTIVYVKPVHFKCNNMGLGSMDAGLHHYQNS